MKFLWPEGVSKPSFKKLEKNLKTEVLIIGGGMAGICTALALKEAGVDYALVEAKTIGSASPKAPRR